MANDQTSTWRTWLYRLFVTGSLLIAFAGLTWCVQRFLAGRSESWPAAIEATSTFALVVVTAVLVLVTTRYVRLTRALVRAQDDAVRQAERETKARTLVDFRREYTSEPMLRSLRILSRWRERWHREPGGLWKKAEELESHLRTTEPGRGAVEIDLARRRTKGYFETAHRLSERQYITPDLFEVVKEDMGVELLDVIYVLEWAKKPGEQYLERLRHVLEAYGREIPTPPDEAEDQEAD